MQHAYRHFHDISAFLPRYTHTSHPFPPRGLRTQSSARLPPASGTIFSRRPREQFPSRSHLHLHRQAPLLPPPNWPPPRWASFASSRHYEMAGKRNYDNGCICQIVFTQLESQAHSHHHHHQKFPWPKGRDRLMVPSCVGSITALANPIGTSHTCPTPSPITTPAPGAGTVGQAGPPARPTASSVSRTCLRFGKERGLACWLRHEVLPAAAAQSLGEIDGDDDGSIPRTLLMLLLTVWSVLYRPRPQGWPT